MNIQDMSPEFIETLSDEQKTILLNEMAENARKQPEAETVTQESTNGYAEEFAMPKAKSRTSREDVKWQGNTFTDDGAECKGEDQETPEVTRAPRTRKSPRFRMVRCSACGKDFEKREDQIFGQYHRCHSCGGTNR